MQQHPRATVAKSNKRLKNLIKVGLAHEGRDVGSDLWRLNELMLERPSCLIISIGAPVIHSPQNRRSRRVSSCHTLTTIRPHHTFDADEVGVSQPESGTDDARTSLNLHLVQVLLACGLDQSLFRTSLENLALRTLL